MLKPVNRQKQVVRFYECKTHYFVVFFTVLDDRELS